MEKRYINTLNRMDIKSEKNCFFTLKDHQKNFINNFITVSLMNPIKTELGRINKLILDKINNSLCKRLRIDQYKNALELTQWFKGSLWGLRDSLATESSLKMTKNAFCLIILFIHKIIKTLS